MRKYGGGLMVIGKLDSFSKVNEGNGLVASFMQDEGSQSFSEMLEAAVQDVNKLQKTSEKKSIDLAAGRVEDISEVMIAAEKANIALQLTTQVRNKVVESYQELMRMQM